MTDSTSGVSRRTVAKGLAWTAPAVAVAAAAPVASASVPQSCLESGLCFGGIVVNKCCNAGVKTYWVCVEFTNDGDEDVVVDFDFILIPSAQASINFSGGGTVPAGETESFFVESGQQGNCSASDYDAFYIEYTDGTDTDKVLIPAGGTGGSRCDRTCG